jgi:pilus assembly protein Flp/PilA
MTIKSIMQDEGGATAIEYGLILALIVLAIMGALEAFASGSITMWNTVQTATANAVAAS